MKRGARNEELERIARFLAAVRRPKMRPFYTDRTRVPRAITARAVDERGRDKYNRTMTIDAAARELLDLALPRLPLKARSRVRLALTLSSGEDLRRLSLRDFSGITRGEALAGHADKTQAFFDFDEAEAQPAEYARRAWAAIGDALRQAERDAAFLRRRALGYVSVMSALYPPLLKTLYDPPAVLFYRGSLAGFDQERAVAVVGTRKGSAAALAWTYEVMREVARAGLHIVSGLALGVDGQAHRAACDAGGRTYAVLGSSVDEVFPAANRVLARRVIEGGGALLSEYPPGTSPAKWRYPERNRVISGLCPATLVVEAGQKSGALITADFALSQNRELWSAGFGEGCQRLEAEGAKRIRLPKDVLGEYGLASAPPSQKENGLDLAGDLARELGID